MDIWTDQRGGGTAFYVKWDIPHSMVDTLQLVSIKATMVSVSSMRYHNIKFVAAYKPSGRRLVQRDFQDLMELNCETTILTDYLNANCGCRSTNRDGNVLQDYLDHSTSETRTPRAPTRLDPASKPGEILDVLLVRVADVDDGEPIVLDELSSDHNPILCHIKTGPRSRTSYSK